MTQRALDRSESQRAEMDSYVRSIAGGVAGEIGRAKSLLDSGAITRAEFDAIKQRALAAG